jgi:PAS domain S-box-containing protein
MRLRNGKYLLIIVGLAGIYFAAARFGFLFAHVAEQVTLVWPPAGIALAALLLFGNRVWPGIALGAFLANFVTEHSFGVSCGIALGNTLEALLGASLLLSLQGFDRSLRRLNDVLGLVGIAVVCSTVSATMGVTILCLSGIRSWGLYDALWLDWWLGDVIGVLLVTPAVLAWATIRHWSRPWRQVIEALVLVAALSGMCLVVFAGLLPRVTIDHPLEYVVFPFIIWAALRFGQPGATAATVIIAGISIYGTANKLGPFAGISQHESLILLNLFLAAVAVTALSLGAAISARDLAERRRSADASVVQILTEAGDLREAGPSVMRKICDNLDWEFGCLWQPDERGAVLRCTDACQKNPNQFPEFVLLCRGMEMRPGVGLPGRIWASGQPVWVPDVTQDKNFPRGQAAARAGLRSAFGFPIRLGAEVLGAMEFFSREARQPDPELLQLFAAVGHQIGGFIERRRAEEALRKSEERFRYLAETIPSMVWTSSPDGNITYVNQRWLDYCGLTREQNRQHWAELVLHPDDRERCVQTWSEALREGREYEIEVRNRRHDGVYRWFITRAVPLRDASGHIVSWFGNTTDIHDQKEMQDRLREADRRKDEFLATLSHEIRNPLAPIQHAVQIMRLSGESDPVHQILDRQLKQLVRLVDDLLDISRLTRGRIVLRKEPVELAVVVDSAMETSRPLVQAAGHRVTLTMPPEPILVDADPVRLAQILTNLINNAAKYTDPGGKIDVSAERQGNEAVIRVRDTGIGIGPEMLPRIFDMFTQAHVGDGRTQGGLGIGLFLVKNLVRAHGGSIWVHSAGPGQGTEFAVRLPLVTAEAPAPRPVAEDGNGARPAPQILVVDDNRDVARSLGMLLELIGARVELVHDGPAALAALRRRSPDAVLLDLGMPEMDGFEVARRIRAEADWNDVVLVALTGWSQESDAERSREAGCDYHLIKPVKLEALETLLASITSRRSQRETATRG